MNIGKIMIYEKKMLNVEAAGEIFMPYLMKRGYRIIKGLEYFTLLIRTI